MSGSSEAGDDTPPDREELAARLELLRAENAELRQEYLRSRQTTHRQTAVALAGIGILAIVSGVFLTGTRAVLFALGATGLFAAVFTYFLTPDRVVPGSVGRAIYDALATTESAFLGDLGLDEQGVYVPSSGETVRLFVPQSGTEVPEEAPSPGFVVDEERRGLAFEPTGNRLAAEFERAATDPFARDLDDLGSLVADALVEQFELADSAVAESYGDRLVVGVDRAAYGSPDRFDHPVASFVAVATARALDEPVSVAASQEVDRVDFAITAWRTGAEVTRDDPGSGVGSGTRPDTEAEAGSESDTEAEAEAEPEVEADAEAESETGAGSNSGSEPGSESEPVDADG